MIRYLQYAMFGAFYPNYFVRHYTPEDQREINKVLNGHDPMTSVYLTHFPQEQSRFSELYQQDIKRMFEVSHTRNGTTNWQICCNLSHLLDSSCVPTPKTSSSSSSAAE